MDDVAIKVEHVSKTFKLPHEKQSSLKGALINMHKRGYEAQQVLDDISFEVKKGEFFGIVGRNGSGKSTLLKLISGIYTQSSGEITVNGKLTPFIELGVGFNFELTGRENVFLNGALLGFSRKEMLAMYDDIVEFAELERFMDQKLKNYSSGMQVRLAFSIAIRANTEILVLDEVLAVGDAAFQQKCADYFEELKGQHKTVILVTHDMESVRKYCDRALLIDEGKTQILSNPEKVAYEYSAINARIKRKEGGPKLGDNEWGTKELVFGDISMEKDGKPSDGILKTRDSFKVKVKVSNPQKQNYLVHFSLAAYGQGAKCFDISTYYSNPFTLKAGETHEVIVEFNDLRLLPGAYSCQLGLFDETMKQNYHGIRDAFEINVLGTAKEVSATGIVSTESRIFLS
jgi:ABC-2 type transport system ATP-binding protein